MRNDLLLMIECNTGLSYTQIYRMVLVKTPRWLQRFGFPKEAKIKKALDILVRTGVIQKSGRGADAIYYATKRKTWANMGN